MPKAKHPKKSRLTVSLSRDAIAYLRGSSARAQAPSLSAYLEDVVKNLQAKAELDNLEASTAAYYDKLSPADAAEEADWGRVGAASLSRLED
ncbi:MAG: hypothetical protein WAL95_12620 [Candidatus Acidiferrales bacterium]